MRLTKKQSIFVAIGILVLFFAVGIGFMKTQTSVSLGSKFKAESIGIEFEEPKEESKSEDSSATDSKSKLPDNQGPAVVLGKFERSESAEDGRPLWEIKAETGRYYPETNNAKVEDAVINYYKKEGQKTKLTANKADIDLDGNALVSAFAYDGVVVQLGDKATIKTQSAEYDKATETVKTEDKVEIFHELMETSGHGMEGNIATQEFVLLDRVTSIIKPQKK